MSGWRTLMWRLDQHFGDDASVNATAAAQISGYLESHASRLTGSEVRGLPRVTQTRWFASKHCKVSPGTCDLPKVTTPANCGACHRGAAQGDCDEHDIIIPR